MATWVSPSVWCVLDRPPVVATVVLLVDQMPTHNVDELFQTVGRQPFQTWVVPFVEQAQAAARWRVTVQERAARPRLRIRVRALISQYVIFR